MERQPHQEIYISTSLRFSAKYFSLLFNPSLSCCNLTSPPIYYFHEEQIIPFLSVTVFYLFEDH